MRPEYVTDVPYVRSFMDDLSPARLRLVAALNGFAAPPAEQFESCELGAGHGDTLVTLAAAFPRARFVGVDLNPEHVAAALDLARLGELSNVRFLERDFAAMAQDELPALDFASAHGVLTWIGPDKREALLSLVSAKLKPGGLFYVGYNALPGWAAVEPLRRLLVDRATAVGGPTLEGARQALDLAVRMAEAGAGYFASNPPAKEMLATIQRVGLAYIAHEYLHAHWTPMYFADMARAMAEHDLYFVGQMPLFLNYRDLALPQPVAALFEDVTDRVTFESLMGYALNQFFRRDVYVKGRVGRADASTQDYFESTPFGASGPIARSIHLPHYTLELVGPLFDALLPILAEGATSVTALAERPELAAFGKKRLREAVLRLVISGQLSPMLRSTRTVPPPEGRRFRMPLVFNQKVLARRLSPETPTALASEAAGTGVPLTMLQVVCLRVLTEPEPEERHAWIRALLEKQPFRLKIGDRAIDDEAEPERALLAEVERFRLERLPRLIELGIVEPV